jgi:ArsR family transcriptional regulator
VVVIVLDYTKLNAKAEILKVLGHPLRLCIVAGLLGKECNVSTMQECVKLPQPIVSQHLAILKRKGIIKGERRGKEVVYSVIDPRVKGIIEQLFDEE